MTSIKMKWTFTFFMVAVTVGWAVFTVKAVAGAMSAPSSPGVLEASGASVLLGAMINWCGNVVQYWFRKKPPEEKGDD